VSARESKSLRVRRVMWMVEAVLFGIPVVSGSRGRKMSKEARASDVSGQHDSGAKIYNLQTSHGADRMPSQATTTMYHLPAQCFRASS
jgi:hypothetical protein